MKIANKNISIEINENGLVKSIKKNEVEFLYQGNESWKKSFPIMFPSLGFSTGFKYKDKEYEMPKHGFWNNLEFESFYENEALVSVATIHDDKMFPQIIDVEQKISLQENEINFTYSFSNLSKEDSYFQFGLHPGFIIDDQSFLLQETNQKAVVITDKLQSRKLNINNLEIKSIPFGEGINTLIYQDVKFNKIKLFNKKHVLTFEFDSNNLQLWKPEHDSFICIEPWYGYSDSTVDAPSDVSKKLDINLIKGGEKVTFEFNIIIENRK